MFPFDDVIMHYELIYIHNKIKDNEIVFKFYWIFAPWHTVLSSNGIIRWQCTSLSLLWQTHWGRDKMAAIFQTIFSNAFSWIKIVEFQLELHWSLFLKFQLTINQWFRECLFAGEWPLLLTWFNFDPAWISNYMYMSSKVWIEITYPFLNFNGCIVEV